MKKTARRRVGDQGEEIACKYLKKKGFQILERNYLKQWGEIDIIALKGGSVRFVEVKTVSRESLPDISREIGEYRPEAHVHPAKLRRLARTAEIYMSAKKDARDYQIDVVGVFLDQKNRIARCRIYEQVL